MPSNIITELNSFLEDLVINCFDTLQSIAKDNYGTEGRGVVYVGFENMDKLRQTTKQVAGVYIPSHIVETSEYTGVIQFMKSYNPEKQFIVCVSVDITSPCENKPNGMFQAKMLTMKQ